MCEEERAPCLNGGAVGTALGLFSGHGVHSQLCGGCAFEGKASRWGKILEQWLSTRDDFFFLPSMRHFQLSHLGRWGTRDAARHCMSRRTVRQMTKDQMRFWWAPW